MKKDEFMSKLDKALENITEQEKIEILAYYQEIIDDKIDSGLDEDDAVRSVGTVEEIISQVLVEETEKPQASKGYNKRLLIVLIAGAPLWIPLILATLSVIVSVYVSAWAIVVSLCATELSLIVASPLSIISSFVIMFTDNLATGFLTLGASIFALGIVLIAFVPIVKLVKYSMNLTKKSVILIINMIKGGKSKCSK